MSPWNIWEESPFSGPLEREKIFNLKWRGHGGDGSEVGIRRLRSTIADSLRHPRKVGVHVLVLWVPVTLSLLLNCGAALRFRGKNECENVCSLQSTCECSGHARLTSSTPTWLWLNNIREQRNKESWAHGETDSQVQVHSEQQLCGSQGRWRRWLRNIPLEIFYQLVLGRSQISPLCWVHSIVWPPRNLISCSVSGFFGMEGCCIVYPILHLILDLGKNATCPTAIIALLSICLLNGTMLSRSGLSILFCKNAFQTFLNDLF